MSVAEVLRYKRQFVARGQPWTSEDARREIQRDLGYEELTLRGPIQTAKGEKSILVVNGEQNDALGIVYGVRVLNPEAAKAYALVQKTGTEGEEVEAEIKWATLRPKTQNHFIISEGLARQMKAGPQSEIKIVSVYQKPEEINLDEL